MVKVHFFSLGEFFFPWTTKSLTGSKNGHHVKKKIDNISPSSIVKICSVFRWYNFVSSSGITNNLPHPDTDIIDGNNSKNTNNFLRYNNTLYILLQQSLDHMLQFSIHQKSQTMKNTVDFRQLCLFASLPYASSITDVLHLGVYRNCFGQQIENVYSALLTAVDKQCRCPRFRLKFARCLCSILSDVCV